jgi:methyl coenzyme M reductase subunit C-like uncharacterized protein (methanogenesis marker protein 7)
MMWVVKADRLLSVCPDTDLTGIQTVEVTTLKAHHPMKETCCDVEEQLHEAVK